MGLEMGILACPTSPCNLIPRVFGTFAQVFFPTLPFLWHLSYSRGTKYTQHSKCSLKCLYNCNIMYHLLYSRPWFRRPAHQIPSSPHYNTTFREVHTCTPWFSSPLGPTINCETPTQIWLPKYNTSRRFEMNAFAVPRTTYLVDQHSMVSFDHFLPINCQCLLFWCQPACLYFLIQIL